jgi:phosphoglycerate dehydrogenase-like enzyme
VSRRRVILHPQHLKSVAEALPRLDIDLVIPDADDLPAAIEDSGILVTFVWDDSYLPGLRWVQSISAGHEHYPLDVFAERGVVLTSASGVHGPQIAEHTFALLLGLTRGVGVASRNAEHTEWKRMVLHEISDLTMGVLGLGAIGEAVALKARAWGMRVIGTKRSTADYRGAAERVFGPEQTAEVFEAADVVVSVLPGGAETDGIVNREMLESLNGWFVNVGRGNVVTEDDIIAALDSGGLLGAGLDVFETEPLPETSLLWSHPRVVITPHVAGLSPHYGPRLAEIFEHNLRAFAGHDEWRNRIV